VDKLNTTRQSAEGAADYIASIRGDFETGIVDPILVQKAKNFDLLNPSRSANIGLEFEFMGPSDIGGRTRGIVVDNEDWLVLQEGFFFPPMEETLGQEVGRMPLEIR